MAFGGAGVGFILAEIGLSGRRLTERPSMGITERPSLGKTERPSLGDRGAGHLMDQHDCVLAA